MSLFHRADQGDKFGCGHLVRHFGLTPPRMRISRSFCASPRLFYKRPCWFLSRQLAWHRCSQVVDAAFRCQEVFHLIGVSDVALPWFTGKKKPTYSPHVQLMTIQPYLKSYYLIYFPDSLCLQFSVCYPLMSQGVTRIDTDNAVTPSKSYLYQILHNRRLFSWEIRQTNYLLKPCEMNFWMSSAKDDDTIESSTPCYYFVGFAFSTGSYCRLSVSE